jgi:HK97 family phage portal protein
MAFSFNFRQWFGRGGAISETQGQQNTEPSLALIPDTALASVDGALQMSTVWSCIDLRASTIASLPIFTYEVDAQGEKKLAKQTRLYEILHDSPNPRMTPFEFWRAMMMNHDLRGNAYARIDRDGAGEVKALWPMPSDQVEVLVLTDGSMVYRYMFGHDIVILAAENVLHLKNLGNGTTGLAKLEFMRSTTDESTKAQAHASKIFGTGGKPTGMLMIDKVLNPEQRQAVMKNFAGMADGNMSRIYLLEANMKYEQLSINPIDQQLLETRKLNVEEICRWFGVPPVMVGHANVTSWGSGISELVQGWHTLSLRPMIVSIEQALRKRVMTSRQRVTMTVEISLDALLRGNPSQRSEMYAKALQNGYMTRAEVRQLEGWPAMTGTNVLTAQSNLVPLDKLGAATASGGTGATIAQ